MAHFAVGFLALSLLMLVLAWPPSAPLLVLPVILSALVIRLRTVADERTVTARTLLGSQTMSWDDVDGLRFDKGSWARAQHNDGTELRLPAVTFSMLPMLSRVTSGRVPNPYS
jgi:hypothetical protein